MITRMHPDDYADQRVGHDLMRHNFQINDWCNRCIPVEGRLIVKNMAVAAAVIYIGTLSWIGHVAWLIQWAGM